MPNVDRRNMMLMAGMGLLASAIPLQVAGAEPSRPDQPAGPAPAPAAQAPTYVFHDEFDGPAGSAPDPSKWTLDDWPFNLPDYRVFPVLNLAVAASGGGDPTGGIYPAEMLVDYVRVW